MPITQHKSLPIIIWVLLSLVLYISIGYCIERTDTVALLSCWGLLFFGYFYIIRSVQTDKLIPFLILCGVIFRFTFLWSTPNLSDDYFRFIWDGYVWQEGINPFSILPAQLAEDDTFTNSFTEQLYTGLNSPNYHSVYPPVSQFIFRLSVFLSPDNIIGNIIIQRFIILLSETGSIYILYLLLKHWGINNRQLFIYALNPLVVIELTGNLHYEAVMLFFLLMAVYMVEKKRLFVAAMFFALSVCTKLLPLLLLPLFIKRLGLKRFILFSFTTTLFSVLLFLPFVSKDLISNISESIGLYFQHFEFNASIFYVIRAIGFQVIGYDIVHTAGRILPIIFSGILLYIVVKDKNKNTHTFFESSLIILFIYYLFSMVVHPWYISTLVLLSVFTSYRFALLWSMLVGFTYISYNNIPYTENLTIVFIEYISVLGFVIYEIRNHKKILPDS